MKAEEILDLLENNGEAVIEPVSEADPKKKKKHLIKYTNIGGWLPYNIGVKPESETDPHEDEPGHPDGDGDADDQPAPPAAPMTEDDPVVGNEFSEEDELSTSHDPLMEGVHYNTRIRALEARSHPVKVRLGIKEAHRMVEEMLNPAHPSPSPVDDESRKVLEGVSRKLASIRESMKHVVVGKRVKR